jgi:plasmid stability protein
MAELILTEVEDSILQRLGERAARHGRTPPQEAKAILEEVLQSSRPGVWGPVDAIYQRLLSSGRTFSDSAELLREDRDR